MVVKDCGEASRGFTYLVAVPCEAAPGTLLQCRCLPVAALAGSLAIRLGGVLLHSVAEGEQSIEWNRKDLSELVVSGRNFFPARE